MRLFSRARPRVVILVGAALVVLLVVLLAVGAAVSNSSSDDSSRPAGQSSRTSTTSRPPGEPPPDPNTTVSVFAPLEMRQLIDQLAAVFTAANPGMSVEPVLGTSSQLLERVQSGQEAGVYIDEQSVVARLEGRRIRGEPIPFGRNRLQLVVARGNPEGIGGLQVFGAQPATVSVVCSGEVPCGVLGDQVLEAAGVVAVPDLIHVDGREAVAQVASGRVDAALLFRSDIRSRLTKTQNVPFPADQNVDIAYRLVRFGSGAAADRFFELAQTEEAQTILRQRGFLAFT